MGDAPPNGGAAAPKARKSAELGVANPLRGWQIANPLDLIPLPLIKPGTLFRNAWDATMFFCVSYNCIMTPVTIAMMPSKGYGDLLAQADLLFGIVFVADHVLNFCFAYVDPDTKELVDDHKAISRNYKNSSRFYINLLATLPMILVPLARFEIWALPKRWWNLLSVLRMTRIGHFIPQLSAIRVLLEEYRIIHMNDAVYRMLQIGIGTFFACTILGSFYFYLACPWKYDKEDNHYYLDEASGRWEDVPAAWTEAMIQNMTNVTFKFIPSCDLENLLGKSSTWAQADTITTQSPSSEFPRAVYFMVQTLFTIGYGDTVVPVSTNELTYGVVIMTTGARARALSREGAWVLRCRRGAGTYLYALIIANMTSVFANQARRSCGGGLGFRQPARARSLRRR